MFRDNVHQPKGPSSSSQKAESLSVNVLEEIQELRDNQERSAVATLISESITKTNIIDVISGIPEFTGLSFEEISKGLLKSKESGQGDNTLKCKLLNNLGQDRSFWVQQQKGKSVGTITDMSEKLSLAKSPNAPSEEYPDMSGAANTDDSKVDKLVTTLEESGQDALDTEVVLASNEPSDQKALSDSHMNIKELKESLKLNNLYSKLYKQDILLNSNLKGPIKSMKQELINRAKKTAKDAGWSDKPDYHDALIMLYLASFKLSKKDEVKVLSKFTIIYCYRNQ